MQELNCCYNCKHCHKMFYLQDIFYCDKAPIDINTEYASMVDITFVRVEPNNICDRWEKKEE